MKYYSYVILYVIYKLHSTYILKAYLMIHDIHIYVILHITCCIQLACEYTMLYHLSYCHAKPYMSITTL